MITYLPGMPCPGWLVQCVSIREFPLIVYALPQVRGNHAEAEVECAYTRRWTVAADATSPAATPDVRAAMAIAEQS